MIKQVSKSDLLKNLDPDLHDALEANIKRYPDCTAVVMFENVDMCSSELGRRTFLVVGPSNTFKSVDDCDGKWLNDLPSQRQYPQEYVNAGEFKKEPIND